MIKADDYKDDDDAMMDSLMDAMEGFDANHLATEQSSGGGTTVTLHFHAPQKAEKEEKKPPVGDDEDYPSEDEIEQMSRMS